MKIELFDSYVLRVESFGSFCLIQTLMSLDLKLSSMNTSKKSTKTRNQTVKNTNRMKKNRRTIQNNLGWEDVVAEFLVLSVVMSKEAQWARVLEMKEFFMGRIRNSYNINAQSLDSRPNKLRL